MDGSKNCTTLFDSPPFNFEASVSFFKLKKGKRMADRTHMVLSVMAKDRPGIVAEVTEAIHSLGGNLADLRESVLRGYFTMILIAGFPPRMTVGEVEKILAEATASRVAVTLHEEPTATTKSSAEAYVLSAAGRDRTGLVALVSRFCCDRGVNILDLASHAEASQYTMMLLLDLEEIRSLDEFRVDLAAFGQANDLALALQHNDIFRATNEV